MAIKIENKATIKVPKSTEKTIQSVLDTVPREHLRGLAKVVLVDRVLLDSRVMNRMANATELPALYHPRQGASSPFFEIGLNSLLPRDSFFKRLAAKLNFAPNLAYLTLSLQAQHYYLTLSHGIKKNQYENLIRSYVEKHHSIWRESQAGWRARFFKPLRPYIEKLTKKLKKYQEKHAKK